ncbi:MAG: hypothetical protein AB7F98_17240 [Novosphingobium sp.]
MKNVFGGIFMGCGILIGGLSGLCTLFAIATAMMDMGSSSSSEMISIVPAALIFGGIPLAIGIGLFFGGRALMNSPSPPPPVVAEVPPDEIKQATPPQEEL